MLKPRKVPLRKCVATNEQHPKMDMFRIVRTPEGNIIIDLTGKARGRGAYLSKSKTAINQAKKKKSARPSFGNRSSGKHLFGTVGNAG